MVERRIQDPAKRRRSEPSRGPTTCPSFSAYSLCLRGAAAEHAGAENGRSVIQALYPVYALTTFPATKFQVITSGAVDTTTIVKPNTKLRPGVAGINGEIVKPTGFYKVIFRPGRDAEPDRAVGFLVPHTTKEMDAQFRQFIARIDVIEQASGFTFSVPTALKNGSDNLFWLERPAPVPPATRACPREARARSDPRSTRC